MLNEKLIGLTSVTISITNKCNLNCPFCATNANKDNRTLSNEQIDVLLSSLENSNPAIDITGGEPLLVFDKVIKIGRWAKKRDLDWGITTNGVLLNEDLIKKLKKSNIYAIKISLDVSEKLHDKYRRKGAYKKVMKVIKLLKKYKIVFGIQTFISKENTKDIHCHIKKMESLGAGVIILFPLMQIGKLNDDCNILSKNELGNIVSKIKGMKTKINISFDLPQSVSKDHIKNNNTRMCSVGYMLHINHNGDYWPCPIFSLKLGNLLNDKIENVFNSKIMQDFRNRIQIIGGKCKDCPYLQKCGGGCRALAFITNKKLNASDNSCWKK